jgi:hypothetical protein
MKFIISLVTLVVITAYAYADLGCEHRGRDQSFQQSICTNCKTGYISEGSSCVYVVADHLVYCDCKANYNCEVNGGTAVSTFVYNYTGGNCSTTGYCEGASILNAGEIILTESTETGCAY